ncbi:unnamed protein product, partial [Rotaria sp. Silwood2]
NFVDQLPRDDNNSNNGLPSFSANSIRTRREIDTLLRIMLDAAPNDSATLPGIKRPKFLDNHLTLSNSLYSPEISEAAACSNLSTIGQRDTPVVPQYPSIIVSATETNRQIPQYESAMSTPLASNNGRFQSNINK